MTAQISDTFEYRHESYALAGVKGEGLYEPSRHGIKAVGMCTACWRGFQCEYLVENRTLWLKGLNVMTPGEPLPLGGVEPVKGTSFFSHSYQGLRFPIDYTGGVLIGSGFLQDLYVHMGFAPAWKFRKVFELLFDKGKLVAAHDRSEQMRAFREEMKDRNLGPADPNSRESIEAWIMKTFSLDYR